MKETTKVVDIHSHDVVLGCITTSCESCAGNSFCNIQGKTFTAKNPKKFPLRIGDTVEVFLPPGKTIASGFMILIVPLIMFLLGVIGIKAVNPSVSEGMQALAGFAGLALGFLIGYLFGQIKKHSYQPIIVSHFPRGD